MPAATSGRGKTERASWLRPGEQSATHGRRTRVECERSCAPCGVCFLNRATGELISETLWVPDGPEAYLCLAVSAGRKGDERRTFRSPETNQTAVLTDLIPHGWPINHPEIGLSPGSWIRTRRYLSALSQLAHAIVVAPKLLPHRACRSLPEEVTS